MAEKNISRRNFIKGIAAGSLSMAVMNVTGASLTASAQEEGVYTPGTYSSVAKGIESDVTVTMTFDANSITDIQIPCTDAAGKGK